MKLRAYLDHLPRGGITKFARRISKSSVYLSQLAARKDGRQPSPKLCHVIELESNGLVTRQELRDDWRKLWPELPELSERDSPNARKGRRSSRKQQASNAETASAS